jgi:cell wall-associated NlpC family hydrolase
VAKGGGISGLSVAMATAGAFLVYAGINRIPLVAGLRSMLRGEVPTGTPPVKAAVPTQLSFVDADRSGAALIVSGGGALGDRIVAAAGGYIGEPYFWGGHVPTTRGGPGLDCSGYVTWVLVQDIGMKNLPSQVHTTTIPFMNWKGAYTVPAADCQPGDLVCWVGHIGIAVSKNEMLHAPTPGQKVKKGSFTDRGAFAVPPVIRRVKAEG